ncbi:hypothetical protein [Rhizobium leguminosarum]|uniref:hypothetical protein n=1 Tax=Rhizobium leguminosarum TaxID=384 RepID=UPI002E12FFD6|nr:hypothetical protein U8Q02_41065 [Rhizobium leguminosarum]
MPQTWPTSGDKMRFTGAGGLEFQLEQARLEFKTDEVLVVDHFELGDWSSQISFVGRPGEWNSVMFELVEESGFVNVGVAAAVPGLDGYTMVVFKAEDVPAGTWVYEKVQD